MSDEIQPTTEEPAAGPAQVDMEARFDGDMRMAGALTREQNIRVNAVAIAANRVTGFGSVDEVLEMAPRIEAYIRNGAEPAPPLPADGTTTTPTL